MVQNNDRIFLEDQLNEFYKKVLTEILNVETSVGEVYRGSR